jgi:hypothetical protein
LAKGWPETTEAVYRRALELADENPAAGLTLLGALHHAGTEGITTLEREIMRDWSERDQAGLQAELERRFRGEEGIADHWLSLAASVVQVENPERLKSMLDWFGRLEKSNAEGLVSAGVSKLIGHFNLQSLPDLTPFLVERVAQPHYREALVQLANACSHRDADQALSWVGGLPDASLRRETLLAVVGGASWDNPALVLEWMNSGRLWKDSGLAQGLTDTEQRTLRDDVMEAYFGSLVSTHPQYVEKYASAIADPEARGALQAMARKVAQAEPRSPTDYWHPEAPAGQAASRDHKPLNLTR